MIRLVIPEPTPSLNAFTRRHWTTYHKAKQRWDKLIWAAMISAHASPATGKRSLKIIRYGKPLDVDNLYGGCKCVIDGLRAHGLLLDDNAKYLDLHARNDKPEPGQKPYTVLLLEDL